MERAVIAERAYTVSGHEPTFGATACTRIRKGTTVTEQKPYENSKQAAFYQAGATGVRSLSPLQMVDKQKLWPYGAGGTCVSCRYGG